MENDLERLIQLLCEGGAAFRSTKLQRAHAFHGLLWDKDRSFYRHLKDAMRGKKPEDVVAGDEDVTVERDLDLGELILTVEHRESEASDAPCYRARAFSLCVKGGDMAGNVAVARTIPEGGRARRTEWELVTNKTWPTEVLPFTRRGRSLEAALHIRELSKLAREQEVDLPADLLETLLLPLDARLRRIRAALRGRSV